MSRTQKKFDGSIRAGKSKLVHDCQCGTKREIPFNYSLKYSKHIHHGQCVEGDVEEWLYFETSLPKQIQCGNCSAVYDIKGPKPLMGKYSNPKELSLYGRLRADRNFGSDSMENIDPRVEEAVRSVSLKFIGIPERV